MDKLNLTVRQLTHSDYDDLLCKWWNDWRWTPPSRDFLPSDGDGGVIIYDGDIPVCAGFMYATNSKAAWIEFVVSNIQYKDKDKRKIALRYLINTLSNVAKNSGFKYCYSVLKNKNLINTYIDCGYLEGSKNTTEMIKIL